MFNRFRKDKDAETPVQSQNVPQDANASNHTVITNITTIPFRFPWTRNDKVVNHMNKPRKETDYNG